MGGSLALFYVGTIIVLVIQANVQARNKAEERQRRVQDWKEAPDSEAQSAAQDYIRAEHQIRPVLETELTRIGAKLVNVFVDGSSSHGTCAIDMYLGTASSEIVARTSARLYLTTLPAHDDVRVWLYDWSRIDAAEVIGLWVYTRQGLAEYTPASEIFP